MIEIWKDIQGFENKYQVSNIGRVKSLSYFNNLGRFKESIILKKRLTDRGYNTAVVYNDGKQKVFKVHRLVAIEFIPNPENKPCVNHIDGNKENNIVSNLEWCTHSENIKHAFKIGLNSFDKNKKRDLKGKFIKDNYA